MDRHLPIEKLTENLWRVEAIMTQPPLHRVMTVVKLADGRGLIHSAVMLDEPSMREIEAWAPPAIMAVPNAYHRKDAAAFKARYPSITVVCPSGARKAVSTKVPVDATYDAFDTGDPRVRFEKVEGIAEAERVLWVRSDDGVTLVFNDLVFDMPHLPGASGFVFRYITASSGGPRVSRLARLAIVKDRKTVRAELERLASTPDLARVIVSHHRMTRDRPGDMLRAAAATL